MLRGSSLRLPTSALLTSHRAEPAVVFLANGFIQIVTEVACLLARASEREEAMGLESHGIIITGTCDSSTSGELVLLLRTYR